MGLPSPLGAPSSVPFRFVTGSSHLHGRIVKWLHDVHCGMGGTRLLRLVTPVSRAGAWGMQRVLPTACRAFAPSAFRWLQRPTEGVIG